MGKTKHSEKDSSDNYNCSGNNSTRNDAFQQTFNPG